MLTEEFCFHSSEAKCKCAGNSGHPHSETLIELMYSQLGECGATFKQISILDFS